MGRFDILIEVKKFNPYHGRDGRFAAANEAGSREQYMAWEEKRRGTMGSARDEERMSDNRSGSNINMPAKADTIAHDLGISREEAEKMHKSIQDFSDGYYAQIRKYQTEGPPPDMKSTADSIESFIDKSPKWNNGTVYRGIRVDNETARKIIENAQAGKTIGQRGTSSWSSDESVAESFAEVFTNEKTAIIFRSNGKQNGTSIQHISLYGKEEKEVIMSENARWKPTNVTKNKYGIYIIDCEPTG